MCQKSIKLYYNICTIISSLWNLQYQRALAVPFHKHLCNQKLCASATALSHSARCDSNLFMQNSHYFKFTLHSGALSHFHQQPICTELALRCHSILALMLLIFMETITLNTAKTFYVLVTIIKPKTIKKPRTLLKYFC